MAEYEIGVSDGIDPGGSLDGAELEVGMWWDAAIQWSLGIEPSGEDPVRTVPSLDRSVP